MKWIPLLVMNFLGILNDNFLKKLFAFISIYWVFEEDKNFLIGLAGLLFIIPYIFFSPYAGLISKVFLKRKIIIVFKIIEFPVLAVAVLGFYIDNLVLVYVSIFLMGLQSCMFSPAKYGLIREVGGVKGISFGTGAFEMTAFLGNLFGVVLAGVIADISTQREPIILILFFVIALAGYLSAIAIKPVEPIPEKTSENGGLNPVIFVLSSYRWSKKIPGLNSVVFSLSLFWFAAAMIEMIIANHCPNVLNMSMTDTGLLMGIVAISIAFGSISAGLLSGKKVELGLVPIGAIGFAVCMILIVFLKPDVQLFSILIVLAAFFAGIYKIPLNAFMQERVKGTKLGDIIAYNNISVFFFILLAAIVLMLFDQTYTVFYVIAVVNILMFVNGFFLIKEMRERFLSILVLRW